MTPFQEELYRLLQSAKQESNAFTSPTEDAGNETHKIIKFSQKWDFKEKHEQLTAEKDTLETKFEKSKQHTVNTVTKSVVKELVPIIDELFTLSKHTTGATPLDRGLNIALTNLEKFLQRRQGGVIRPKIGEQLDPVRHQAVSAEQDPSHHGNSVSEVYRYGYYVMGKVIREAEVKVKCGVKNPV